MAMLNQLSDWKQFERLCADLLEEEHFNVVSEPYVDRTGVDFVAVQEYRAHDPNHVIRLKWRVQCKHLAASGAKLGRKEVEEILTSYEAARSPDEGLFIMVSSDYTEAAKDAIDKYLSTRPTARVLIWNSRQLESRLDRHPQILKRYGLLHSGVDFAAAFKEFGRQTLLPILFLSDQSVMAHNLARALRQAGLEIVFLPFWNYLEPIRLELVLASYDTVSFRLVICFLGDSFSVPMPRRLVEFVLALHDQGTPVLLFPFTAWSMSKGLYRGMEDICPVELLDPKDNSVDVHTEQIISDYRRGDFRWLLQFDSFAEDRYVEYDPGDAKAPFEEGTSARFGLSHSFEFLRPTRDAEVVWSDTGGNPLVVIKESSSGKSCYINTCCHGCMSSVAISSPLEVSGEFVLVLRNCLRWLFE